MNSIVRNGALMGALGVSVFTSHAGPGRRSLQDHEIVMDKELLVTAAEVVDSPLETITTVFRAALGFGAGMLSLNPDSECRVLFWFCIAANRQQPFPSYLVGPARSTVVRCTSRGHRRP